MSLPRQPSSLIASGIGGVPGVQDYSYKYIFSCCARGWQMQSIGSLCPAGARCTREWGMLHRWTSKHITKNKITSLKLAGRQEINILVCRLSDVPITSALEICPWSSFPLKLVGIQCWLYLWMINLPLLADIQVKVCLSSHPENIHGVWIIREKELSQCQFLWNMVGKSQYHSWGHEYQGQLTGPHSI